MTGYQYKTVAAPRRVKKAKGVKGRDAQLAHAIGELISAEASQGWEYQRTDTFPVEEKGGLFSKSVLRERAVLVFRKPVAAARPAAQPAATQRPAPQPQATQPPAPQPAPPPVAPAKPTREEPGFSIAGVEPNSPRIGGAND